MHDAHLTYGFHRIGIKRRKILGAKFHEKNDAIMFLLI